MYISVSNCVWSGYIQGSLEVYWAGVVLSMETAYSLLLGSTVPLHRYHVFAHLCRLGYIVRRHSNRYSSVLLTLMLSLLLGVLFLDVEDSYLPTCEMELFLQYWSDFHWLHWWVQWCSGRVLHS